MEREPETHRRRRTSHRNSKNNKRPRAPRRAVAGGVHHSELLEQRVLLSITSTILGNPETTQGNTWTYNVTSTANSNTSTLTTSVGAPTTDQGQPATEVDTTTTGTNANSGAQHSLSTVEYLAQTSPGLVQYEERDQQYLNGALQQTDSDTYSTPLIGLPATLDASTPVTETDTEYDTETDSTGTITQDTSAITEVFTLMSDTTMPITVAAGTFNCYQVTLNITTVTTPNGSTSSSTSTSNEVLFLAKGVGLVQLTTTPAGSSVTATEALTSFTGSDRLVFTPSQLPNVQAGNPIQPAFTVSVEDPTGDVVTDSAGTVTLTPAGVNSANPITGNTAALVDGIATFSNVVLTKAGVYQLQATDSNNDLPMTSLKFGVGGDKLVFKLQPRNTTADTDFDLEVQALTPQGKLDTELTDQVVLTLNAVSAGATGELVNGEAEELNGGIAGFDNLQIDRAGTYTITASADTGAGTVATDYTVSAATSDSFSVSGLHLSFTAQPKDTDANASIQFGIQLLDAKNKPVTSGDSASDPLSILFSEDAADNEANLKLSLSSGRFSAPASGGLAVADPGNYTFTVTAIGSDGTADTDIVAVTSTSFNILGYHLSLAKQPVNTDLGAGVPFTVYLLDSKNKRVTSSAIAQTSDELSITASESGGAGMVGYSPSLNGGGYTSISSAMPGEKDLFIDSFPGTYTLHIEAVDEMGDFDPVVASTTSKSFQILGYHLSFAKQPQNADTTEPVIFTIYLLDSKNKRVTDPDVTEASDVLDLDCIPSSAGAAASVQGQLIAGVETSGTAGATGALALNTAGTYTIKAQAIEDSGGGPIADSNVAPVTSASFKVLPDKLVFSAQPQDISYGGDLQFTLRQENASDQNVDSSQDLTLTITNTKTGAVATAEASLTDGAVTAAQTAIDFGLMSSGTYTITAEAHPDTEGDGSDDVSILPATSHAFTVSPLHLAFAQQPAFSSATGVLSFSAQLLDDKDQPVSDSSLTGDSIVSTATSPSGSTVTLSAVTVQGSTVTFSAPVSFISGTMYQLTLSVVFGDGSSASDIVKDAVSLRFST